MRYEQTIWQFAEVTSRNAASYIESTNDYSSFGLRIPFKQVKTNKEGKTKCSDFLLGIASTRLGDVNDEFNYLFALKYATIAMINAYANKIRSTTDEFDNYHRNLETAYTASGIVVGFLLPEFKPLYDFTDTYVRTRDWRKTIEATVISTIGVKIDSIFDLKIEQIKRTLPSLSEAAAKLWRADLSAVRVESALIKASVFLEGQFVQGTDLIASARGLLDRMGKIVVRHESIVPISAKIHVFNARYEILRGGFPPLSFPFEAEHVEQASWVFAHLDSLDELQDIWTTDISTEDLALICNNTVQAFRLKR